MDSIRFTAAYDEKTQTRVLIYQSLNTIFQTIGFQTYVQGFEKLGVVFQCFEPSEKIVIKQTKSLRRKTKTLELYLVLDYERIMQGSDQENLLHIKEVFVKGCETFLKPLKEFKWEEFESKVREALAN